MSLTPYFEDQAVNVQKLCEGCEKCNQRSELFQVLSEDEPKIINKDRYSVRFRPGEVILKQGTHATSFISIIEGFAKMYIEGHHDRNLVLDFVMPWKLVGSPGIHLTKKYMYTVVAIQETLVCFLNGNQFNQVMALNSRFAELYIRMCSGNYGRSLERMVSLAQKQMHGRIADALIYLSEDIFGQNRVDSAISRQDLADYTAMSKDSAIRILKEFERDNIVGLEGGTIEILDPDRLHSISMNG
ncbi:MAG: Crp/Fnr family transcriptional regulator [Bacteroidales bacterium]